jgi:hypothetical protein
VTETDRISARIAALLAQSTNAGWLRLVAHGCVTHEYGSVHVGRVDASGTGEVAFALDADRARELVGAFETLHAAWLRAGHASWEWAHVWLDRDGSVELEVELDDG